jgi:hypothetical protein
MISKKRMKCSKCGSAGFIARIVHGTVGSFLRSAASLNSASSRKNLLVRYLPALSYAFRTQELKCLPDRIFGVFPLGKCRLVEEMLLQLDYGIFA